MPRVSCLVLILLFSVGAAFAQSTAGISTEAQRAYLSGDLATAKEKFQLLLQIDPSNRVAVNYLRMIRAQEQRSGGGGDLERNLQSLILPKVEFRDATFADALEALKQQAAKISEGKVAPSFILQLPPELARKPVTLNLANVPFREALRYLGQLTGTQFVVEKYAVVVKPIGSETPASTGQ